VVNLISVVVGGFIAMFFPMNRTVDLVFAIGGCLIFSGYVIFDTHLIINRLSPDEYILGAIDLYLEYVLMTLLSRLITDQSDQLHQPL
jgi:protein lifeguard